jgi:c-di-GMP-binding flagellar brake protein YcgR
MKEKRKLKRRRTLYCLKVFDCDTHSLAGRLIDITAEGMMLISSEPVREGDSFKLRVPFPEAIGGKKHITVDARNVWCAQDSSMVLYEAGFKFLNVSPDITDTIERSMGSYLFPQWETAF